MICSSSPQQRIELVRIKQYSVEVLKGAPYLNLFLVCGLRAHISLKNSFLSSLVLIPTGKLDLEKWSGARQIKHPLNMTGKRLIKLYYDMHP